MNFTRFCIRSRLLKATLATALVLGLVSCGGGDDAPPTTTSTLTSSLSGDQQPTPTITGALGKGTLSLALPSRALSGSIILNGMTATVAHIHEGEIGVNGAIIVPLTETPAASGTWAVPNGTVLSEAQASVFDAGGWYFNAHSAANPTGEIRGQIGREVYAAQLSSVQEVPVNVSKALGNGLLSFNPLTKKFTARLTLTGIVATAAHIHSGITGVNGPIIFALAETAPNSGVWVSAANAVLTEAQISALSTGGLYFNAHSAAFPAGEIRGQIGQNLRFASLSAGQEVPVNSSTASGKGTLIIDPLTRKASGSLTLVGMTATAAHIHLGASGVNGAIVITLVDSGSGVWTVAANTVLTADQLKAYKQGNLYFNAHSVAFPSGEIRGQIL